MYMAQEEAHDRWDTLYAAAGGGRKFTDERYVSKSKKEKYLPGDSTAKRFQGCGSSFKM